MPDAYGGPLVVVERGEGVNGELVLRSDGVDLEVIANGVFLMDTRRTASERQMVRDVLARVRPGARLLVGGLGVGSSVVESLEQGVGTVHVVEIEPLVIRWWDRYLRAWWGLSGSDLDRVEIVNAPLQDYLSGAGETYDAIVLDTDNGPDWLVTDANATIYAPPTLAATARLLAPGGVCVYWSAHESADFEERLIAVYGSVERVLVQRGPVPPDVLYVCTEPFVSPEPLATPQPSAG